MWTTLGIEIWALLSTDLFCLLCSFIVIYRHRLLCTNSSCITLSKYFLFLQSMFCIRRPFDFHPLMRLDMACICALQSTLPLISLSIQMKRNQATFPSFQLVSLISCSALLTEAAQLWPVGLSAPYLMTHAQPTATCCTFLISRLPLCLCCKCSTKKEKRCVIINFDKNLVCIKILVWGDCMSDSLCRLYIQKAEDYFCFIHQKLKKVTFTL